MRRVHWLELAARLYPHSWRERYAEEVFDLARELAEHRDASETKVALSFALHAPRIWTRRVIGALRRPALTGVAGAVGVSALLSLILYPAGPAASSATTVPFTVTSGAMLPTLRINEVVQVKPFTSQPRIESGEIVIFRPPATFGCGDSHAQYLVKRVIGLSGQTVSLSNGHVFIDGKALRESWLAAAERGDTYPGPGAHGYTLHKSYRVEASHYYVLGDNRTDSCDSRYFGPVGRSLLYGEVVGTT